MKVISIANRKGGVGKTVTTQTLGAGLRQRGFKVLLLDLDSQCNLTYDVGAKQNLHTTLEVLTEKVKIKDAIQHTANGDIVPANPSLAAADTMLTVTGKEYKLKEALEPLKELYDYIIIDTPPALNILTVNALTSSDKVIITSEAELHSLQGIGLLNEAIETMKKYTNPNLKIEGILITIYNSRTIISRDMKENLESIAEQLNTKVFKQPIRICNSLTEAQAKQTDIFSYAPKSNATKDYNAFIDELLEER